MSFFSKGLAIVAAIFLLFALACQDNLVEKEAVASEAGQENDQAPEVVEIRSLDELMALFDKLNYNSKSWAEGNREVPRLTFERVSERWQKTSKEIPVPIKKQVFFRLMAPLVLIANENVLNSRKLVAESRLEEPGLKALALKYKVIPDADAPLDEMQRQ